MSTRRGALLDRTVLTLVAAATTWLATLAWRGFAVDAGEFLTPLLGLALVVPLTGVALHWARLPEPLVVTTQVLTTGVLAGSIVAGAPVVTGGGWASLGERVSAALESSRQYEAPVPVDAASVAPLLILGGWLCLVLVDVSVGSLRRAPLAGLPLLTIYSIPVSLLGGGVPWWSFALTASGFLLLLFLQQRELAIRWGRGLGTAGGRDLVGASHAVRVSAGSLGGTALVLAVMLPQFVPTLSLSVFDFGPGEGGDGVTVENPMVDLRRDLNRGEDVPLVRVRTDNPDPSYLRIAALNNFGANEWSTGDRDLPAEQGARGTLPLDDIGEEIPRRRYEHEVLVLEDFESKWLPTSFPIQRISADGDWRYDVRTQDFLSFDPSLDSAGMEYSMLEVDLEQGVDPELLTDAASWSGMVSRDYVDLPDGFPSLVRNLAQEITRDYPSRYEKAVAMQRWFREGGGFEYSLDQVPPGNGPDELVAFLTEGNGGRVGYCEQFAAAMAAMSRSLGIPARVAVGFLTPEEVGRQTYEYSAYDMHAWPELYFAGTGWVRFEPTPADRAPGVPSYTQGQLDQPQDPSDPAQPDDTAGASPSTGPDPRLDEGAIPESEDVSDEGGGGPGRWLAALGAGLLALSLLLLPRTVRRNRQRRRLHGGIEPAWRELEATALDLGLPWPAARSPRETRAHLVPMLGDPDADPEQTRPRRGEQVAPDAVAALDRLVGRLERLRYAPPRRRHEDDPDVTGDTELVLASLRAGATRRARRRADWWPATSLPWRRGPESAATTTLVRHGGVVDHVG